MGQENVDVVRRMYEAFHGGDSVSALAQFDPAAVFDATARPDGEVGHGREAVARISGSWVGAFEDWSEQIEEIRDLGEQVLVVATQRGRGKGSGLDVESRYAVLFRIERGKITRMTLYGDRDEALAAVGLVD